MNRYIISLPASHNLQAIADYFAVENVEVGEKLLYAFKVVQLNYKKQRNSS
ncbi:hypothetical protein [Nostoc sp.]|uniref:hypothetical protein n=1 Tax=Nostoc sp. TaxID=1180 RepID=UPI002FF33D5B